MSVPGDAPPPAGQVPSKPEFALRVVTAAVLAPVVLLAVWAGGIWFALLVAAAIALAGQEWSRLCIVDSPMATALMIVLGPVLAIAFVSGGIGASLLVLALALISAIGSKTGTANRLWSLAGVAYLGIATVAVLWLRADLHAGLAGLIFLLGAVWLSDIGAYVVGRTIGGPRLAPAISPGKTWAGACGGLLAAAAGAYGAAGLLAAPTAPTAVALALGLSLATQCGDLFESWVKRRFGKKDSGTIIPGHGGILDRIDGLLFAAPVMAAITIAQPGAAPLWP